MAKLKILLVDSDEKSLSMMTISLKKADFNVTQAHDGEEAWGLVRTIQPDLIISDTKMPRMDGFTFCRKVKNDPALKSIPFIFLTREKSVDDKIRGLELGVDDYLTKPIYLKEVLARVRLLLEKREKEKIDFVPQEPQFAGSLSDMGVVDLIQTMEMGQKTGVIYLQRADFRASISFDRGRVVDAKVANVVGEQAVYKLLLWSEGSFRIDFRKLDEPETVTMSTQGLIMEGMRRIDELVRIREQLPPLESLLAIDSQVILEDHPDQFPEKIETILAEFTGTQTLQQVVDKLPYDDLECLEIIAKLYFQGFLMPVIGADSSGAVLASEELQAESEEPLFNFAPPEEEDTSDGDSVAPFGFAPPLEVVAPASVPTGKESAKIAEPPAAESPAAKAEAAPKRAKPKQGKTIVLKPDGSTPQPPSQAVEKPPQAKTEPPNTPPTKPAVGEENLTNASTSPLPPSSTSRVEAKESGAELATGAEEANQPPRAPRVAIQVAPSRSRMPWIALAAVLLLFLIGAGAWYALNGGFALSSGVPYSNSAVNLKGEPLDLYKGASLNMNLDTPAGYRRAVQGFEALAERMDGWDATDQEIILAKLILSYARLSEAQDDSAALRKARELSEAYLKERPNSAYLLIAGAETAVRSAKVDQARQYLARLDPRTHERFYLYHFVQGLLRLRDNAPDLALVSFHEALEKNDDFPLGHYSLGRAYEISQREADAIASYQAVTRLSPNHASAHYQLAKIEKRNGNAAEAKRLAETAVAVAEEHLGARLLLAESLLNDGSLDGAMRNAETVLELAQPGRNDDLLVGAHIVQGEVAIQRNAPERARRHFDLALQISPSSKEALSGIERLGKGNSPQSRMAGRENKQ